MFNFFPPVFHSSLGNCIGSDKIEVSTFTSPKIKTPATILLYDQKTHEYITRFNVYNSNSVIIENVDLKNNIFFIVSHDPMGLQNAAIADNIGGSNYVDD